MKTWTIVALVVTAAVFPVRIPSSLLAHAQSPKYPHIEKKIIEIGPKWNDEVRDTMLELYTPILKKVVNSSVKKVKDIRYGSHKRHRLDVYTPRKQTSTAMPILVFMHGGGFIRGSKSNGMFYDNIGYYFAKNGVLGVVANYRLAPESKWPSGPVDIALIIEWIHKNAKQHGGDPDRIYLMGHSAGAAHIADFVIFEPFRLNDGNDGVKGAILVSGMYGLYGATNVYKNIRDLFGPDEGKWPKDVGRSYKEFTSYYGTDENEWWAAAGRILHMWSRYVPLFIISAEFDPWHIQYEAVKLTLEVCKHNESCPWNEQIPGANHASQTLQINSEDDIVGPKILDFIRKGRKATWLETYFSTRSPSSLPAHAQSSKYPHIEKKIIDLGPKWNDEVRDTMGKLYWPIHEKVDNSSVNRVKDIRYGPHERHRLDVYTPRKQSSAAMPVLVYMHGGGHIRGSKSYATNIGYYFAKNGVLGVVANYRLAPESKWPSGPEDMALIINWIHNNAVRHGGDPDRIYLMGGSAGAKLVADYVFFERFHVNDGNDGVKGAILMSSGYGLEDAARYYKNIKAAFGTDESKWPAGLKGAARGYIRFKSYYGLDESKWSAAGSIHQVAGRYIPLFITSAEFDPPSLPTWAVVLALEVCKKHRTCPRHEQIVGANHASYVSGINTEADVVGHKVLDFIRNGR